MQGSTDADPPLEEDGDTANQKDWRPSSNESKGSLDPSCAPERLRKVHADLTLTTYSAGVLAMSKGARVAGLSVDPEQVEQFAAKLSEFSAFVRSSSAQLNARFADLRSVWNDPVYLRFERDFQEVAPVLTHFVHQAEKELVPYLWDRAKRARDYESSAGGV